MVQKTLKHDRVPKEAEFIIQSLLQSFHERLRYGY